MEQLKKQNNIYKSKIKELENKVELYKKSLESAKKNIDELTRQVEAFKNEPKNEINQLKAKIDDLKQEKIGYTKLLKLIFQKNKIYQNAFQSFQNDTNQLKININNLITELNSKNDDDQLKDIAIERLKNRIKDLLQNEMQIKNRNILFSNKSNENERQIKELNRQKKALENINRSTGQRFLVLIPKFNDRIEKLDKRNDQNKKRIKEQALTIKAKEKEVENLIQENLKLKATLKDVHDDTSQLENKINDLSTELNSKNNDQMKDILIERLKERITDLMSNMKENNTDNIVGLQDLIDIKSDLDHISQELDRIQEENSIKDVLIEHLKNRIDELR